MPHAPILTFTVSQGFEGKTAEWFLLEQAKLCPRSALKRAFRAGEVRIQGRVADRTDVVRPGDEVTVASTLLYRRDEAVLRPNGDLSCAVVVATSEAVVVNKPAGRAAHPLRPSELDTELSALAARYPETGAAMAEDKPLEGGLVHRIDRGTSGLLTCARTPTAWANLRLAWREHEVEKVYLAWLAGGLAIGEGRVDGFLHHDPKSSKRMIFSWEEPTGETSWPARTSYRVLRAEGGSTLVLVRIHTGVMHQIRATFSALGAAVLGDEVYGKPRLVEGRKLTAMDMRTKKLFNELEGKLGGLRSPVVSALPERGFFLHAYALRVPGAQGLDPLVLADVPRHFSGGR